MLLRGTMCVTCGRKSKKLSIVSDQILQAEEKGDCFKHLGKLQRMLERNYSTILLEH